MLSLKAQEQHFNLYFLIWLNNLELVLYEPLHPPQGVN